MNVVCIKNIAGVDIYINRDQIDYFRQDPMNLEHIQVHVGRDYHIIRSTVEEFLKVLGKK